jgi:MinD-like ATPase involved in chromosome partitioning or flagellar assembly
MATSDNKSKSNFSFPVGGPEWATADSSDEAKAHEAVETTQSESATAPTSEQRTAEAMSAAPKTHEPQPHRAAPVPPHSGETSNGNAPASGEPAPVRNAEPRKRPKLPKIKLPKAVRPTGAYGMLKFYASLLVLIGLATMMIVLHGTFKTVFLALLVLGVAIRVATPLLNKFLPKQYDPPTDYPKRFVRGWYWKLFGSRIHARLGWEWLATRSEKQRFLDNSDKLWDGRWIQIIVAFANLKGGSAKTAICVWLVALYAKITTSKPLAIDVNENAGHTASRLGIKRDSEAKDPGREGTIEMREYLAKCLAGKLIHKEELVDVVDWHRETGVMVIASNRVVQKHDDIDNSTMRLGLRTGKNHAGVIFADCGNDLKRPGNLNAVRMAGRLVFCGNSHMAGSCVDFNDLDLPDDLKNTMDTYTNLSLGDKVRDGILVIIGRLRDRKKYADHYEFPLERVFVIPFNRYMKLGRVVKLKKIPLRVLVVLSDILVAIMDEDNDFLYEYDNYVESNLEPAHAGAN